MRETTVRSGIGLYLLCLGLGSAIPALAQTQQSPAPPAWPAATTPETPQATAPPADTADVAALVHRALVENKRSLDVLRNYIFQSSVLEENFGKDNQVTKTTHTREEIFFVDGEPVERVLDRDGQPLAERERDKQERGIEEQVADSRSATPRHREERQNKAAKALAEEIAMREDIAAGFVYTVEGHQNCEAHRCVVLAAEPRPGFKGGSKLKTVLPYLHGRLVIDEQAGQWTAIDVTPTRKLGAAIVYLNPDTAIHLEQIEIPGGLWVLGKAQIRLDSRLLWERRNLLLERTNTDFRRFGADVRIVDTPSAGAPQATPQNTPFSTPDAK